jgi:outer membrane immunogenic protein
MYRKLLLASVAGLALTGSAAFAADLPSRAPPPVYLPPVPIFTWTGIYLGGQVGYAWGNNSGGTFVAGDGFGDIFTANFSGSPQGVIGGAHVGYNYQINQWVFGIEGSVDGTSLSKTVVATGTDLFGATALVTAHSNSNIQGSIRGRLGVAWDRALLYATGGVAFAGFNSSITDTSGFLTGIPGASASFSNTRVGWTVGGGIEYAITNNWSVRGEYRYSNFGNVTNAPLAGVGLTAFSTSRRQLNENQVQVGFSYKFDTWAPAPVVARY